MNRTCYNMEVTETIIRQMGGFGRLKTMIGAHNVVPINSGVRFAFKMFPKANVCEIEYVRGKDLYTLKLLKINSKGSKVITEITDLYNDQLKPIFEQTTGLYLSL